MEGGVISPAIKTEIGILRDKISKETDNKYKLEKQYSDFKNQMKNKTNELDKLKKDAHGFLIGSKKGYKEKYELEEKAWEKDERDAAKAAARKEKEKNTITELVIETNGLITSAISKTSDGVIIAGLKVIAAELSNIENAFKANKRSYIDANECILELKDATIKIGTEREKTTEKSPKETYYDILGVDCKASQNGIKNAYRKIIQEYHPDHQPLESREWVKKDAETMSKKINEAYSVLNDPETRKKYNRENGFC